MISKMKKEWLVVGALFVLFLLVRVYSDSPYYFIQGGDEGRYLALAQQFPSYTHENNQFYLVHPPLFSSLIAFFGLFMEDFKAGMLVSLLSGTVIFFVAFLLAKKLTGNVWIAYGVLLLYSLSQVLASISVLVYKEPLGIMLTLLCIYFALLFMEKEQKRHGLFSAAAGLLTGLTTDHALFLIPSLIMVGIIFWKKSMARFAWLPLAGVIIGYGSWLLTRVSVYLNHTYYPAAFEGVIVDTSGWEIQQVLSPQYFQEVSHYIPFGVSFDPLHYIYPALYMLNNLFLPWPSKLTFSTIYEFFYPSNWLELAFYGVLTLGFFVSVILIAQRVVKKRSIQSDGGALIVCLFLIFLSPLMQKLTSTRYTLTAVVFLFMLVMIGCAKLLERISPVLFMQVVAMGIVLAFLVLPFYLMSHPFFIFSKEKIVELSSTAKVLEDLPEDGVMMQIGYTQELNYLSDKRVMALPITVDQMKYIDMFNISYVLYGEFYMEPFALNNSGKLFNHETIRYIREHPEEFELLHIIEEKYAPIEKRDHIYLYKVKRPVKA